ncbi:MAG: hypothetical protein R3250_07225 [Melioribacteraceae bacterium]|nr:hypothetical protein [Melioribacteraceae bacterium]
MNIKGINSLIRIKNTVIIIFLGLIVETSIAQINKNNSSPDFWSHVRFGGGLGLSFGDGVFSGTIAPSAIYQFDSQFALGTGLSITYFERKNLFKSTVLGGSLIGLFNPIPEIQLSSELEQLKINRNYDEAFVTNPDENYWYSALFLGAGYRSGNLTIGIRFDVLYDADKSIYADPWMPFVRVFF